MKLEKINEKQDTKMGNLTIKEKDDFPSINENVLYFNIYFGQVLKNNKD